MRNAAVVALIVAVLFGASVSRAMAQATPSPPPAPVPTASPAWELAARTTSDTLSNGRGVWTDDALTVSYRTPNAVSGYALGEIARRFGFTDDRFEGGLSFPVSTNRSSISVYGAWSPQHNILPQSEEGIGFDARGGAGYGLQGAYAHRQYTSVAADITTLGGDHYFGNQRLAYALTLAHLTDVPGVAASHTLRWSYFGATDTWNVAAFAGRDVENTGTAIAVYRSTGLDVDETHWFNPAVGVNVGVGQYNLTGAYNRFEVRFGLRERI